MRFLPSFCPVRLPGPAALGLVLLTGLTLAAGPAGAQTVTFNFDTEAFGTATTFSEVRGGIVATFSSPSDPGGFTVFPSLFTTLTGNVLIDNLLNLNNSIPLIMTFSQPSRSFALNFAQNTTVVSPFTATFFSGSTQVGSATAFGAAIGPNNSEGVLSFSSSSLFNSVMLRSPNSTGFAVDNIRVDAAPVPEASTLVSLGLLLALGMGGLPLAARLRKTGA